MHIISKIKTTLSASVRITFVNYGFKLAFRFILLIIVPIFLSASEMGYWYTFISVAALTTFADLGFTSIITQFSAHEVVKVNFDNRKKNFANSEEEISSISSLFRFSVRWSGLLTIACSVVIVLVGMIFFNREDSHRNVVWFIPWIIYAVSSSLNFFNQIILAFFDGCNQIVTTQKIKLVNGIIENGLGVLGLYLGWGLYALAVPMLLSIVVSFIQIILNYKNAIMRMINNRIHDSNIWGKQILHLLWKYAISWVSGYIIFQIYNPLIFAKYGSEMAGKVGYLLTIVGALVSVANIWSYVSVPQINMLTEKKDWKELDSVYKRNLVLIELTFILEVFACLLSFKIPYIGLFASRYIFNIFAFLCLALSYVFQLATSYIGVYLRSHKQEPLMVVSVITAFLSLLLTVFFIHFLQVEGVFLGFLLSVTIMFPVVLHIKREKVKQWHQ